MKVLVIGGTGHVGNFLCPLLKERGHEVVIASRGTRALPDGIKSVVCDSGKVESLIPLREEGFDTVIDFPGTAKNVYEALGVADSIVRERVFDRTAELLQVDYDVIFKKWIHDNKDPALELPVNTGQQGMTMGGM